MGHPNNTPSYNPYFLLPFCIWISVSSILLLLVGNHELFIIINKANSSTLDRVMSIITLMGDASFIIPILLAVLLFKQYRNRRYLGAALMANIGAFLLSQGLKSFFNFPRPLNYFQDATWIHILPEWDHLYHRSFPSGHTTGAFALFSFLAFILPKRHQAYGLFLFALAVLVSYSRIYLTAHFFTDVFVGSIIGTFFSTLAIYIFYKKTAAASLSTAS